MSHWPWRSLEMNSVTFRKQFSSIHCPCSHEYSADIIELILPSPLKKIHENIEFDILYHLYVIWKLYGSMQLFNIYEAGVCHA